MTVNGSDNDRNDRRYHLKNGSTHRRSSPLSHTLASAFGFPHNSLTPRGPPHGSGRIAGNSSITFW